MPTRPQRLERPPPAEVGVVGGVAAEAADDDAAIDAHLVKADRARTRRTRVEVRDQRERRRNVERLADSHQRASGQQLLVAGDVSGRPGDQRPDEQAAGDDVAAAVAIREIAADRAEERVDPFEQRENRAPVRLEPDVGDVAHHRELHRREHLSIEIVEERDRHQQRDDEPGVAAGRMRRGDFGHSVARLERRRSR